MVIKMSAKKETEKTSSYEDDKREIRTEFSQQHYVVRRVLDETRDKIKRTIDEARKEVPRNTQAINDYQENTLQVTREIADNYLESQKEVIQSFQDTWLPYVENTYGAFWNNWASPRRAAELYAKTVSNMTDNWIATTRVSNNVMFANIDAYKTITQRQKDDLKELSRILINAARMFEHMSREAAKL